MNGERNRSIVEVGAVREPAKSYDVAILGGGLAGLCLSIQLKKARPQTSVAVLEKREGPAPLAAFKVGESTVPAGAFYFAEYVGMRDHLNEGQLKKCGLRFFPPGDGNHDITKRLEFGQPVFTPPDTWQIDRGLFENKLAARARTSGVDLLQGARVRDVDIGADAHRVTFEQFGSETSTQARWVVDAAGRASLLKRKLGLEADDGHHINAAWFRLGGGLDFEQWGASNAAWMGRMSEPGIRQYSTNHLMGKGYWVWLIPLSTGPISIGVCADPRCHPFEEINEFGRLMDWLSRNEPELAAAVEPRVEEVEDFLRVEDFSYGVKQTYSTDRWTLVGEAGAFADPFFSPGSDFIGLGNTLTTDLVTRELDGEDIGERVDYFNSFYQRAFESVISRYRDSYPVFGNPWVSCGYLSWVFFSNHTAMVFLFYTKKLADLEFLKSADDELERLFRLNINTHKMFREWNELTDQRREPAMPPAPRWIIEHVIALLKDYPDDDALREELRAQVRKAEAFAVALFNQATKALPESPANDRPINPYAITLDPQRWDSELYDASGLTIDQAREVCEGIDVLWYGDVTGSPTGPPGEAAGQPVAG